MAGKRRLGISGVLLIGLVIATVASFGGGVFWLFEFLSHLKPHLALAALLLAIYSILKKHVAFVGIATAIVVINAYIFLPYFQQVMVPDPTLALRVLSSNLRVSNTDFQSVTNLIDSLEPDIIGLTETNDLWKKNLSGVSQRYDSFFHNNPGASEFGMAILSRYPITDLQLARFSDPDYPALVAKIDRDGVEINVVLIHPPPPLSRRLVRIRNDQFDAVAKLARANPRTMVLGDFNSTPWAPSFRRLTRGTSLKLTSSGFAYSATWPTGLGLLGIPIDHILISNGMEVVRHLSGRSIGSDHRPIFADIVVRR